MHRLFAAIRPSRAMREQLLHAMGGVPGARWQSEDQLHLTLRFIGEVDRHRAEDVAAALGAIHHPAFSVALDGVGQFERKGRIDALWAAVTPHAPLKLLHNKIDHALVRVGLPADQRAYLPHITLARFLRGSGAVGPTTGAPTLMAGAPETVREFCLYESTLGNQGASYSIVERYPLH
jgi:2'-5' RNA ligase